MLLLLANVIRAIDCAHDATQRRKTKIKDIGTTTKVAKEAHEGQPTTNQIKYKPWEIKNCNITDVTFKGAYCSRMTAEQ